MGFFIIAVIVILIIFIRKKYKAYLAKKRADLLEKYKDEQLVDLIMKKMFRMDMTEEQLIDSIGKPDVIDRKILKTKTKEIWK
ncbi:hypothetical protein [Gilliamella apis]|uniref:Uncharacterized protein n=1 Tax=Gilliamella apis TaxID=1970738 RepID=A0A242NVH5_9GAMM|nr:hypothetical protein [Gilliamella apis]OTQ50296.1 hypothetical protein B6D06_04710 [Gilliamella apis]